MMESIFCCLMELENYDGIHLLLFKGNLTEELKNLKNTFFRTHQ
jgi:hypothetical protein